MSIGNALAEARRQAGLAVAQVSQQTRIRESIIRLMEQDDFSACGGDFYARGHIRSIAGVVGIDPVPLIREYDEEHGALGEMRAAQIFEPAAPIKIRESRRLHPGAILVVVLLAVLGFGAYHLVSAPGTPAKAVPAAVTKTTAPAAPVPSATPPAPKAAKPPRDLAMIRLTATSDCWIKLSSVTTGKQIYLGVVPAGQAMKWDERKPVTLVIGNPPGVRLTVNGKTQRMSTMQVITLNINPSRKTPVTLG